MKRSSLLLALPLSFLLGATALSQDFGGATPLDQLSPEQRLERRVTPEVEVVRAATPSVVFIQTNTQRVVRSFWGTHKLKGQSSGSGVVLSPDGFIVTNYHVVKDASEIRVSFEKSIDDKIYDADLLSFVQEEDLALLKIRNPEGREFAAVPLGTSSDLMIGEKVVAIGNPYGHTNTVSVGIISGLHRGVRIQDPSTGFELNFDDLIQTDASINPGNSGGPLLNINGELIGINNAVNQVAENIGFAIPIDRVKTVLQQQLISPERYSAWFGFDIDEDDSIEVSSVLPGSPAALAGLRAGDRVLGLGDQPVENLDAYRLARVALQPGVETTLKVQRGSRTLPIPIQGWDKSDGLIYERLGVQVDQVSYSRRGQALRLSGLLAEGPAASIGLAEGDVINAMRPRAPGLSGRLSRAVTFSNRIELAKFLDRLPPETDLEIEILRGQRLYQGTLVLR